MTKLLEKVIARLAQFPEQEHDALARIVLDDLASEQRWAEAFDNSQVQIARLGDEAMAAARSRSATGPRYALVVRTARDAEVKSQ